MSHREPHAATEPRTGAVMGMRGCEIAAECRSDRPGHRLHAMQERLAVTTASKWVDAIVLGVDEHGFATVAEFSDDDRDPVDGSNVRRVWHHDAFEGALAPGEPVAIHALYGVLARGRQRFSVAGA
ncbi:MAG: hypothetical protein K0S05_2714 [Agromyces sp.]|jgi:hypothetical protein|nr:hypothetical protein [Agromyces sp.]